jgi:peptidyl-prolyl cis-trans isomerase SurA
LIEKKGDRVNCRHILLKPRVSVDDKVNAISKLDSIRIQVVDSGMSFEAAVAKYSEDKNTLMSGGLMTNPNSGASKFEYQDLPAEIAKQIYAMKEGDVSQPFVMMDRQKNKEVCAIVKLKTRRDAHKANLVDDFQVILQMLEQKLSGDVIEQWIRDKQKEIYVQIDPAWRGCDFEYPGWVK